MDQINTSFFEIFKIGPGPSSSHTIGPMKAAYHFIVEAEKLDEKILDKASYIEVSLYGSLSATGKGHGTDKAILAGLLKNSPETCDAEEILNYFNEKNQSYIIQIKNKKIPFDYDSFNFEEVHHLFPFSNTLIIRLFSNKNNILLEKEYYSVGGGFIRVKDEKENEKKSPKYPYNNMESLKKILKEKKISLIDLLLENEKSITGISEKEIYSNLNKILKVMQLSVKMGISTEAILPGPIKLERKAKVLYEKAKIEKDLAIPEQLLLFLDAYAMGAAEENAAGHLVVTAPTSGACGILPSIVMVYKEYFSKDEKTLSQGLMVASMIGFIAKHNASISGAEVGCQGEVGVAASMGAAFISYVEGFGIDIIENAAEIALEHQLGLTCDPILGYVQIPCIERNAVAAVTAYNSFLLASSGDPKKQKISFDQVVNVMLETGKDMCLKYKETSKGGLALCDIEC